MSAEKPEDGPDSSVLRPASPADCDAGAGTFLQTGFWGAFKSEFGWKPRHFRTGRDSTPLLVLERALARGFSFAYIPRGPSLGGDLASAPERLGGMAEALRSHLSADCVFLRVDPPWYAEGGQASIPPPVPPFPFRRAGSDVQVPDTVILDLRGASDEELLARMKPKWRYNIKYAEKKGVEVASEPGPGAVEVFYSLYRATALRDRIALHPERYYARLVSLAGDYGPGAPEIRVWIARYRGTPLAAIITSYLRGEAVYLYGASGDEHRNLMPAYALQWAALRAARDAGCGYYDFFGIPPSDDPGHPMAGLYRFKTGFGGTIRRYPGSWDYPLRRFPYGAYRAAEGLRGFWFKTVRKRLGGAGR